jgi:hypothetical protein
MNVNTTINALQVFATKDFVMEIFLIQDLVNNMMIVLTWFVTKEFVVLHQISP